MADEWSTFRVLSMLNTLLPVIAWRQVNDTRIVGMAKSFVVATTFDVYTDASKHWFVVIRQSADDIRGNSAHPITAFRRAVATLAELRTKQLGQANKLMALLPADSEETCKASLSQRGNITKRKKQPLTP